MQINVGFLSGDHGDSLCAEISSNGLLVSGFEASLGERGKCEKRPIATMRVNPTNNQILLIRVTRETVIKFLC